MTIYGLKDLDHYRLRGGDIVVFRFENEHGEFVDLNYVVEYNFLMAIQDVYNISPSDMYHNDAIFTELGLDPREFCSKYYGYESGDGRWPYYKDYDYEAASNIVKALYTLIDSTKMSPLIKSDLCTNIIWNGKEFGYNDINGEWKPVANIDYANYSLNIATNCSITSAASTPLRFMTQGTTSCRHPGHTSLLDMPIDKLKKIASQIKTIKEDNNSKLKKV